MVKLRTIDKLWLLALGGVIVWLILKAIRKRASESLGKSLSRGIRSQIRRRSSLSLREDWVRKGLM